MCECERTLSFKNELEERAQKVDNNWKKLGLILGYNWIKLCQHHRSRHGEISLMVFELLNDWASKQTADEPTILKTLDDAIKQTFMSSGKTSLAGGGLNEDKFLYGVAEELGVKWRDLGRYLGLSDGILQNIEVDNRHSCTDAAMQMLFNWRSVNSGRPECFSRLLQGMKKVGLTNLSTMLDKFRKQNIDCTEIVFILDTNNKTVLLGSGSFGNVFKALYIPICEAVAVKMIHSRSTLPPDVKKDLLKEVENMSQIQCPYTVNLYGALMDDESHQYAVIMELMPNGSLSDLLGKLLIFWSVKVGFAVDVCRGMVYLHSKDMIHTDLKAGNVLLDGDLRARISDFGQARFTNATSTFSSANAGTPTHMAPEVLDYNKKIKIDFSADVYSFGIFLFELCAELHRHMHSKFKRLPYYDDATSEQIKTLLLIYHKSPITEEQITEKIAQDCPDVLLSTMKEATSIDPSKRKPFHAILKTLKEYKERVYSSIYEEDLRRTKAALPPAASSQPLIPVTRVVWVPPDGPVATPSRHLIPKKLKVQHFARLSEDIYIRNLTVARETVLGLKAVYHAGHETCQIVELDTSDAREVGVLYENIPGRGRGLAMTNSGDLYVVTKEVLLHVAPSREHSTVIKRANYHHCQAARDHEIVYAIRVEINQPVYIDTVVGGQIVDVVETEVQGDGYRVTCGFTWEEDVLFICSSAQQCVYKVRLTDGRILDTYSWEGRRPASELNNLRICCTDPHQHQILITDECNHRLQVLNTRDRRWSVIDVSADEGQQLERPRCAVVKGDTVMIGGDCGMMLWLLQALALT